MSYTTILNIYPGDRFEEREELRNGWLTAPLVWDHIWDRYGEKRFEHDSWATAGQRLWDIQNDVRLTPADRVAFFLTFDRFYVARSDFDRLADDLTTFLVQSKVEGHWPHICQLLRSKPDVPALGFHWTSVAENPFAGPWSEDREDYDPIDWATTTNLYEELDRLSRAVPA